MNLNKIKSEITTKIIGFVLFLVLLGITNVLTYYINNNIFLSVVNFLNKNFWLIAAFIVIFLVGEVFSYLEFPLNIPFPLFNAVGGIFLLQFVFRIFRLVLEIAKLPINFGISLRSIENIVTIVVFIILLVAGYVGLIKSATKPRKKIKEKNKKFF